MKEGKPRKSPVPGISSSNARYQRWVSRAYAFAAACLFVLAIAEMLNWATPLNRTLLMLGIAAAGTAAWVMQAKRRCPNCDAPYGYHFRLVKANTCRKCGAEFPPWRPGMEEDEQDAGS
jgi:hypothetical protein